MSAEPVTSDFQPRTPYQGLTPYSERDAPFFFGRNSETNLIIANLFASSLTLLYGVSGVGKSSILRAGVAHTLKQRQDIVVVVFNTWQSNPLADLKSAVNRAAEIKKRSQETTEPGGPAFNDPEPEASTNSNNLAEFLTTWADQLNCRLFIILDQFEEYFLYHGEDDAFAIEFPEAVTQSSAPISFLISIREDSYTKLDRFESRIPALFDNYLRLEHLNREAATEAIVKPLQQYNKLTFTTSEQEFILEPELISTVLDQVTIGQLLLGEAGRGVLNFNGAGSKIETPFLQMVMTKLWFEEIRQSSCILRLKTLERLGMAERIVRTHLDEIMSEMPGDMQEIAAKIFHYLVTPSGTKIAHTIPDLAGYASLSLARITPVVETLAVGDVRILRGIPPVPNQPNHLRYEIFHDVLGAAILDWRTRYLHAQKLENTNKRNRRLRRIVLLITLIAIVMSSIAIGLSAYIYRNSSVESKLERAIEGEKLFEPPGENAYELYRQFKADGATAAELAPYEVRLLPLLTTGPLKMFSDLADPLKTKEVEVSELELCVKLLSWAGEIKPDDSSLTAKAALCKGRAAYLNKDMETALYDLGRSSELDQGWGQPSNLIGRIYFERRNFPQARSYYGEAIRREPNWAIPYSNMGTTYFFERNYETAKGYYQKAIEVSPQFGRPHLWLAEIATREFDNETALHEYRIAIDLIANSSDHTIDLERIKEIIRNLEAQRNGEMRIKN